MKKLFSLSSRGMHSGNKSHATNTKEFAAPATTAVFKLWQLGVAVLLGALLLAFSPPAMGQAVNATLLGTVTDTTGAVVAGAKVSAKEMKKGISRSATTNDSGNYEFADLPPGQNDVATEMQGFKKDVQ